MRLKIHEIHGEIDTIVVPRFPGRSVEQFVSHWIQWLVGPQMNEGSPKWGEHAAALFEGIMVIRDPSLERRRENHLFTVPHDTEKRELTH